MSGPQRRQDAVVAAVLQPRVELGDEAGNWARADALLAQVGARQIDLLVLPEAFASGICFPRLREQAEPIPDGPTCRRLGRLARERGVHIVAGVLEAAEADRVYDSAVVYDPAGRLRGRYRRRHLWIGERGLISPGEAPLVLDTEIGRLGILVGYDLAFPRASETFLLAEVDLIVCPALAFEQINFNLSRQALLRAMDHHCFAIYANAVGVHFAVAMRYTGGSGVYADPYFLQVQRGERRREDLGCLARAGEAEAALVTSLPVHELGLARDRLMTFKDEAVHAGAGSPPRRADTQECP